MTDAPGPLGSRADDGPSPGVDYAHLLLEFEFVKALAAHTGDDYENVRSLYLSLNVNARFFAAVPQGWAALSACLIARDSGIPPLVPTSH